MVKWFAGLLACCGIASAALGGTPDWPKLLDAERDAAGRVWGVSAENTPKILLLDGTGWRPVDAAGDAFGMPRLLRHTPKGSLLAFYPNPTQFIIREYTPDHSRVFAQLDRAIPYSPELNAFVDSRGTVWIMEPLGKLTCFGPNGDTLLQYDTPAGMLINAPKSPDVPVVRKLSIQALEDGAGRIWFWSYYPGPFALNGTGLRGFLVFDGKEFIAHPTLPTLATDARISAVAVKDARHLWICVEKLLGHRDSRWGLMVLDTETLAIEPQVQTEDDAFANIERILPAGEDLYVIGSTLNMERSVWRASKGERLQRVIARFDDGSLWEKPAERPVLPAKNGVVIGSRLDSPWFIPRAGEAVPLDWKAGLSMSGLKRLFQMPDEKVFALRTEGQSYLGKLDLPPKRTENRRVEIVSPEGAHGLLFDSSRGSVWGILDPSKGELNKWDGDKWIGYPIPAGIDIQRSQLTFDSFGRLWVVPRVDGDFGAAFFAPNAAEWKTFPSFEDALVDQVEGRPTLDLGEYKPAFDAYGQIVFFRVGGKLAYFNGKQWQHWSRKEITGENAKWFRSVGFDPDTGNLRIETERATWAYRADTGWKQMPPRSDRLTVRTVSGGFRLPPSFQNERLDWILKDNQGTTWFGRQRQLFKCRDDRVVPVFGEQERHPFLDGRIPRRIFVDASGNAFLETPDRSKHEYVRVAPCLPLPRTRIDISKIEGDSAQFALVNRERGKCEFAWRVDDGEWNTSDGIATAEALSNGEHRLEVVATNEELALEAQPAQTTFSIQADTGAVVAKLIRQLTTGNSDQREKAVTGLAKRPALAAPALRAARAKAQDERECWWLDAAIQEVERSH